MKTIHKEMNDTNFGKVLFCIPKILKNESNSQLLGSDLILIELFCIPKILKNEKQIHNSGHLFNLIKWSCFVSQRY